MKAGAELSLADYVSKRIKGQGPVKGGPACRCGAPYSVFNGKFYFCSGCYEQYTDGLAARKPRRSP